MTTLPATSTSWTNQQGSPASMHSTVPQLCWLNKHCLGCEILTYTINLFDIRKASWVWMTNIGCVYRTNLWHTTAVRKFFRLFLENLMEFSNENYIENVSTIKHQNLIFVTTWGRRFCRNLCFSPLLTG